MVKKNKSGTMWIAGAVILVISITLFVFIGPSKDYTGFAQCLSDNDIIMYGAYWCGHCEEQKADFGKAKIYLNYVECDPEGLNSQTALCKEKGISGYPTWEINGNLIPGKLELDALSSMSGCELP